jgi:hypothetical protein
MRRFLYYIPSVPGVNPHMLAELGLLPRFIGASGGLIEHVVAGVPDGPAGTGCIVASGGAPIMASEKRVWVQGERFWTCIEDLAPGPADLVRELGISGYEVTLLDGNAWRVPLVMRWETERLAHVPNLPKSMAPVLRDGRYVYESKVRAEFAAVLALAERTFAAFVQELSLPAGSVFADAVELLAVNYRIGVEEAGLIGILDGEASKRVLELAIDLPRLQAQAAAMSVDGIEAAEPTIEEA